MGVGWQEYHVEQSWNMTEVLKCLLYDWSVKISSCQQKCNFQRSCQEDRREVRSVSKRKKIMSQYERMKAGTGEKGNPAAAAGHGRTKVMTGAKEGHARRGVNEDRDRRDRRSYFTRSARTGEKEGHIASGENKGQDSR
jgi:hypothetical protein